MHACLLCLACLHRWLREATRNQKSLWYVDAEPKKLQIRTPHIVIVVVVVVLLLQNQGISWEATCKCQVTSRSGDAWQKERDRLGRQGHDLGILQCLVRLKRNRPASLQDKAPLLAATSLSGFSGKGGASGVLEDLADTLVGLGRALDVVLGSDLFLDLSGLEVGMRSVTADGRRGFESGHIPALR